MSPSATPAQSTVRTRTQSILSRGVDRVARLDQLAITHRLILRAVPHAITKRFDTRAATDLDARFELQVRDPRGGQPARFRMLVSGGRCETHAGAATNPDLTASVGVDDMIRLVGGTVGWPDLLSSGRLELAGDPFLGLRFPMLFRLPARSRGPLTSS